MRVKPDEFGICHRDGCGNAAKWECEWILRNTPVKALTTVKVCDDHKNDASDFILNNANRDNFVRMLVDENWCPDYSIAYNTVKLNSLVEFLPLKKENQEVA